MSKIKKHSSRSSLEIDGAFVLKLVLFLIVGSQWVWFVSNTSLTQIPIPIGLIIGFAFASHDHFKLDRKIEYAVLLIAMLVGFWAQVGIYIHY
jgi:hypothetical protein